jgi:uncharacterized protein YqcC (DUF446 family)
VRLTILFSRHRTAAEALACLQFVFFSRMIARLSRGGSFPSNAEIQGTATERWEGNLRPVAGLWVYVLATQQNSQILALLKNREQALVGGSQEPLQEHLKRCNELVAALKALGESSGLRKTDNTGRFEAKS